MDTETKHKYPQREGCVKTEAEIGMTLPQAKECQKLPDAGRSKEGFSPRAFGRNMAQMSL